MIPENLIGLVITGALGVLGIAVGGLLGLRGKRREGTPDAWTAADLARAEKFQWQTMYYDLRNVFKGFARRMLETFGEHATLTEEEREVLARKTPDDHLMDHDR